MGREPGPGRSSRAARLAGIGTGWKGHPRPCTGLRKRPLAAVAQAEATEPGPSEVPEAPRAQLSGAAPANISSSPPSLASAWRGSPAPEWAPPTGTNRSPRPQQLLGSAWPLLPLLTVSKDPFVKGRISRPEAVILGPRPPAPPHCYSCQHLRSPCSAPNH